MNSVLAATRSSRGGFSSCLAVSVRRVIVLGVSTFHLEPGKIQVFTSIISCVYIGQINRVSLFNLTRFPRLVLIRKS